jgi:hypothetical protein
MDGLAPRVLLGRKQAPWPLHLGIDLPVLDTLALGTVDMTRDVLSVLQRICCRKLQSRIE